jgi:hypothetical protein
MSNEKPKTPTDTSRRTLMFATTWAVVGGAAATLLPLGAAGTAAAAEEAKPMFMFVQLADDFKADPATKTMLLLNVSKQTVYFSDRPKRLAGHLKMDDYLKEWAKAEGNDNFTKDPPNATLSVYEPGQPDSTLAVVEISHPKKEGADLIYTYKVLDGKMPISGGTTTLFIDAIGIGGGVGVGFHGVGVGLRGPGVL